VAANPLTHVKVRVLCSKRLPFDFEEGEIVYEKEMPPQIEEKESNFWDFLTECCGPRKID
jgi:hypothetical protein